MTSEPSSGPVPAAGERAEDDVMAIAASEAKRWQPLLDRLADDPAAVPPVVQPARTWIEARSNAMTDNPQTGRSAVPVVHPEPAEGATFEEDHPGGWDECGEDCRHKRGYIPDPTSVVHPEPGDRAEDYAQGYRNGYEAGLQGDVSPFCECGHYATHHRSTGCKWCDCPRMTYRSGPQPKEGELK